MSREHAATPGGFDWQGVDARWRELEEEIARRTFLEEAELASDIKRDNQALNNRFVEMWREAFAKFEPQLKADGAEPISIATVFEVLEAQRSPLWQLAADIYKTATRRELNRNEAKAFAEAAHP